MGIQIALDDFGTGYSSLNYLQKLPIDISKIDNSFIDSISYANTSKLMVGSIISLVHEMEISVVAEGVENEQQLEYLKNQNCDFIQEFLWGGLQMSKTYMNYYSIWIIISNIKY
ncbi:EAL domain-containing protein [[Clostridium] fimetarium]|uniref:EAL domain-containing protein n=1 Tax=[Clostridium] fimetarium TaxID=99656 RepID=A0A1I0RF77_9FIRM|nr:EAL domain-containing protein [[Clostridium] fimetarium]SEW39497.1 EAL domain-containing protein [[Clostridium] fimetarium]